MDWTCTSGDWVHVLCRIRGWDGHLDDVDGWCLDAWRVWPGGQRKRLDLRVGPLDFAPKFDKNCAVVRLSCWEISGIVCWRKVLDDVWWYRIIILYNYTIIIYDRPSQATEQGLESGGGFEAADSVANYAAFRRVTIPLAAFRSCKSVQPEKVRRFTEMRLDICSKIRHCLMIVSCFVFTKGCH